MSDELWRNIPEFPAYQISNMGRIYNERFDMYMRTSYSTFGHCKITLRAPGGARRTRSVAQLVADAFVDVPNFMCDQVIVLDGDFTNVVASNLAWRPRWFAWKYTHQLKQRQPKHFMNLVVYNVVDRVEYDSIVYAGMSEGLLFQDIWASTYTGRPVYPNGSVFEISERV